MDDRVEKQGCAALVPLVTSGLQTSASLVVLVASLTACGGGGTNDSARNTESVQDSASLALPTGSINPHVVALNVAYRGKTYTQWVVSFWQWALALRVDNLNLQHPFNDCTRPISAGQTGNVWYWSAPDLPNQTCNQSATTIPAGTSIFLSTLDDEASSLDAPPFQDSTAAGQLNIAKQFADYIQNLFVTIDKCADAESRLAPTSQQPDRQGTAHAFYQGGRYVTRSR